MSTSTATARPDPHLAAKSAAKRAGREERDAMYDWIQQFGAHLARGQQDEDIDLPGEPTEESGESAEPPA